MAGGYILDPATGMPSVKTASGALLPLPMSADQLSAAGLPPGMPGPPGAPQAPPSGPDGRLAMMGYTPPPSGRATIESSPAESVPYSEGLESFQRRVPFGTMRGKEAQMMADIPEAAQRGLAQDDGKIQRDANTRAMAAGQPMPYPAAAPAPAAPKQDTPFVAKADPGSLEMSRGGGAPASGPATGDDDEGAIRDQLMREAMQPRGGGGGPRQLGIAGETRKFTTAEHAADPALVGRAAEAGLASDAYQEQLAKSLNARHEQAYQAQQGEYAARAGQMAAQQQRYEQQQSMLQDYQAKRNALVQEAAQLKTPQMEDYWGSRGTFANVMTGLSIALGGALQGLRGGSNPGLEMSNQAIDRWIASQREEYQRAKGRVDDADNQYAKLVNTFGSENLAMEHMREQAWTVRDGMLKSYAEHIGTPSALEAYNAAMLQSEAQKAELQARASQGAAVEIEQKLSMQGGGGGAPRKTFRQALAETAGGIKDYREITKGGSANPNRAIDAGKTDALAAALDTVQAAEEIVGHVKALGYSDDDTDDPRSGLLDAVKNNVPGTDMRRRGQDLDQATFSLARGAQQFLGKSDNDAALAEQQASGLGGSGRQREQAAMRLKQKAVSKAKLELAAMTPDQRNAFLRALAPDQRSLVEGMIQTDQRGAASEQKVQLR